MARDWEDRERAAKAAGVFVRLVLPPYMIHFKSPTYIKEATLELLDKRICKETVKSTASSAVIRDIIGADHDYWSDVVLLLRAAIPSLERRSFTIWDPSSVDYESTSGALIASHYPGLWKDLERLNDIISISRNVLTIGPRAQDVAADQAIEAEVFRLINCCVRVTARGYDGDAGTGEEEKWQWIVNAYKKLLITSLQFLNNLVAQNERRKLMLWVSLFDHAATGNDAALLAQPEDIPATSTRSLTDLPSNPLAKPTPPVSSFDILVALGSNGNETLSTQDLDLAQSLDKEPPFRSSVLPKEALEARQQLSHRSSKDEPGGNGYVLFGRMIRQHQIDRYVAEFDRQPTRAEMHLDLARRWTELQGADQQYWMRRYDDECARWKQDLGIYGAKSIINQSVQTVKETQKTLGQTSQGEQDRAAEKKVDELHVELTSKYLVDTAAKASPNDSIRNSFVENLERTNTAIPPPTYGLDSTFSWVDGQSLQPRPISTDDMRMLFTAEAGAKILESGKAELMKRLEGYVAYDGTHDDLETRRLKVNLEIIQKGNYTRPESPTAQARQQERVEATLAEAERRGLIPSRTQPLAPTVGDLANAIEQDYANARYSTNTNEPHRSSGNGGQDKVSQPGLSKREDASNNDDEQADAYHDQHAGRVEDVDDDGDQAEEDGEEYEEEGEGEEEEEEEAEEGEEEEEDYPGSTEDGRGLLTDVPLILGPSEIEVLPMLIMSGVVPPPINAPGNPRDLQEDERSALRNMHTVRTHLLLSQSTGRNLLRELLIFVAAWDLREEELYFKFMVKIMEAILSNGLMPYAYHAFRDRSRSKDIISPAQAVIMKLLTCIFRARGEVAKQNAASGSQTAGNARTTSDPAQHPHAKNPIPSPGTSPFPFPLSSMPSRVDLHILNFIFTEFRQHIIPQTCALIFLQGQIHAGRASPEDFPLNLWDMERMYEGVYQYLEFFAVLSEEAVWKGILGQWEMASELVTLLRELEGGIPKLNGAPMAAVPEQHPALQINRKADGMSPPDVKPRSLSADAAIPSKTGMFSSEAQPAGALSSALAVERPFEIEPDFTDQTHVTGLDPNYERDHSQAYTDDSSLPAIPGAPQDIHGGIAADQDEPSDFEWRNLKKLTVLVLSSLIWKNRPVQDQVRRYGGLKALVACCRPDEHNPYIREHAIMCLRFAVEGCEENADVIRKMAGARKHRQQQLQQQQTQHQSQQVQPSQTQSRQQMQHHPLDEGSVTLCEGSSLPAHLTLDEGNVPREVLDAQGYETFLDPRGQVGLRKKDAHSHDPSSYDYNAHSSGQVAEKPRLPQTKMTAEKAAELMQNALRDLPLGDKLMTDKQKADALAKLDKAFESTEKAIRQGGFGMGTGSMKTVSNGTGTIHGDPQGHHHGQAIHAHVTTHVSTVADDVDYSRDQAPPA